MQVYRVGSNIDSWCTKCKLVLAHTIEAVAAGIIKRVMCNTCRGKHQFKANEPGQASAKPSKAPRLSSSKNSKPKSKPADLARLLQNKDSSKCQNYSIKVRFRAGDLISHVKFGMGVVVEEKDSQKIEVLFEDGAKILVHDRV